MIVEIFMAINPPTVTHQEKQAAIRNGKPVFYEPAELKSARVKLKDYLWKHRPEQELTGALLLTTKRCFLAGRHGVVEILVTTPDKDN